MKLQKVYDSKVFVSLRTPFLSLQKLLNHRLFVVSFKPVKPRLAALSDITIYKYSSKYKLFKLYFDIKYKLYKFIFDVKYFSQKQF